MLAALTLSQTLPLFFAVGALSTLALWLLRFPSLALGFLFFSIVVGQSWRSVLPAQGGGILISDVAVILVLLSALVQFFWHRQSFKIPNSNYVLRITDYGLLLLFLPFLLWSLFTLVIHVPGLGLSASFIAGAYWLRLSAHLLLVPALIFLARQSVWYRLIRRGLVVTLFALTLLGLLQFAFVPYLAAVSGGWDPHRLRLVSTWLDPNFFGGLIILTLPWLVAELTTLRFTAPGKHPVLRDPKHRVFKDLPAGRQGRNVHQGWSVLVLMTVVASVLALILTQSRSSLLALFTALLIITPLLWLGRTRLSPMGALRAVALIGLLSVVVFVSVWLLGERAAGLVTYDATVSLRAQALRQVWELAREHSIFGVGYNAYQFAAAQAGLIGDFTIHSRAGADMSLLTLWVTTGIPGVVLFSLPWGVIVGGLLMRWVQSRRPVALAAATGLLAWWLHALFVNSLLYAHLLIVAAVITAIGYGAREEQGVRNPIPKVPDTFV